MLQCLIYDNSLKFSRGVYGALALISFLAYNQWIVLVAGILMIIGAFSTKFNIPYQIHRVFSKKILKKKLETTLKDPGELNFACSMGGIVLLAGFLLL